MDFKRKLSAAQGKNNSLLCVGLDPDVAKLPTQVAGTPQPLFSFNKAIIDATASLVCAYKPNSAFYEARGAAGIEELKQTCAYIQEHYPDIPIILDFKRGDIGNTNNHYAAFAFDYLGVDAVTVQPYQGRAAVQSFLDHKDKGIIVLCRTSNEGAGEFQDLDTDGRKLYLQVADKVAKNWNANGNCLLVVGATAPAEMAAIRQIVGDDMIFLVPGIGAQGGDIEATLKAGGPNLIINSARAIIYAGNPRQAATEARDQINKYRSQP
jgi:orotidine-5'-phosphate decarboxylase